MSGFNLPRRFGMRTLPALIAFAMFVLGVSGGCGGKIPPTHYYKLDLPAAPASSHPEGTGTAILMPFRGSKMLTQDKIIYRPSREKVGFYEYHRWAEDPRTTIAQALLDHLRQKKTFSRIVLFDGRTSADYIIHGRIEQLEEIDSPQGVSVALRISANLVDVPNHEPLWHGAQDASLSVSIGQVDAVVSKMSEAASTGVAKLAADLDAFVRGGGLSASSSAPAADTAHR